jgi:hypothetical protein
VRFTLLRFTHFGVRSLRPSPHDLVVLSNSNPTPRAGCTFLHTIVKYVVGSARAGVKPSIQLLSLSDRIARPTRIPIAMLSLIPFLSHHTRTHARTHTLTAITPLCPTLQWRPMPSVNSQTDQVHSFRGCGTPAPQLSITLIHFHHSTFPCYYTMYPGRRSLQLRRSLSCP